ncbi:restriction endonuclease subunit S (plasmid) [Exiguobacterium mexicanum]|uniref:Restriction endonuclease subunit S n=1 Tax=Exiguobacterium mexicanum TaxID=340146 RepID=A0ABT7MT12_9BACL|nr:restriction endonuclease subunit S [Exiguobacterium mexicanum]MDL5378352.1 restriction endonuclease subunit S [Exiguobacterium mexicanum]
MKNKKPKIRFFNFEKDWNIKKLEDGSSKIGDGLHGTPVYSEDGEIAFINGNNLINGEITLNSNTKYVNCSQKTQADRELNLNTILMSINGTIGNLAWYREEKIMLGKSVAYINISSFDKKFVYQMLQTSRVINYFLNNLTGSTIKNLGLKTIRETPILIPCIEEQQRIGVFLKKIDETLSLHQQELEALKQTKKGFLQKMFPKEAEVIPAIRFNDFEENWETKKISEIATETFGGGTPKTAEKRFWSGDIPWIQSSDITQHKVYEVFPKKTISEEAVKSSATKLIPKDSIAVVTRVGVGKLALIEYDYSTSQDFVSLSNLKSDKWFTVYSLYRILQRELYNVQGTSIKGITKSELLEKNILLPPNNEEQVKIGEFFRQLDEVIELKEKELEALKETKKGFLQKMFV